MFIQNRSVQGGFFFLFLLEYGIYRYLEFTVAH
jgi:hypothetical protein